MFAVRRFIRNRQTLTNYISTSSAVRCEESKKSSKASNTQNEKETEDHTAGEVARPEEGTKPSSLSFMSTNSKKSKRPKKASSEKSPLSFITPEKSAYVQKSKHADSRKGDETSSGDFKTDMFKKLLASSAENVARDLGGNKKETKEELLNYIKEFEVTKEKPPVESYEVLGGEVESVRDTTSPLFAFKHVTPLNLFSPEQMEDVKDEVVLNIWDALEAEDLKYRSLCPPRHHFEELIQWTNEGKLWKFPIDNDQGREEEAKVSFTEHVFLERHLEPWCPKKGPLRKFMELVLIGLSKNPFLTVEEKKEHIKWFENYFDNKKKLLRELGATSGGKEIDASDQS